MLSMNLLIRNIPDELHKALRHEAVDRGVSMNALLLERIGARTATSAPRARAAAAEPIHFRPDPKSGVR